MSDAPLDPAAPPPMPAPHDRPPTVRPDGRIGVGYPCLSCGYDLIGVTIGQPCPECGTTVGAVAVAGQSSGKAVAALVLGICSIVTCMMYGVPAIVCGILALVFHKKAMRAIQEGLAPVSSRGMAVAGRVCGIIGLSLGILYAGFAGVFIAGTVFKWF